MQKTMNTRSMIFTLYGDYIRHYGGEIWIGSLIQLLKEFGHNEQSVRAAISRMGKQGWVRSVKRGNKSFYLLTEKGMERLNEAARRIFKLHHHVWDGKWRLFTYTIPEDIRQIRDELRQELIWSGFGSLSNSCWISPNALEKQVNTLINKYEITPYVHFFTADYQGPGKNKEIIEQCWDISEINRRYESFITEYSQKYIIDKTKIEKGEMTDGKCFVERTKLVHEYRKFLFIDPGLPKDLLPDQWLGDAASSLFADYYKTLAIPAVRFFEAIFRLGHPRFTRDQNVDLSTHPFQMETNG